MSNIRNSYSLVQLVAGTPATTSEDTQTLPFRGYSWSITNNDSTNNLLVKFHKTTEAVITVEPGETHDVDIAAKVILVEASAATVAYRINAFG